MSYIQRCLFPQHHAQESYRVCFLCFSQEELRTCFDFGDHFYDPMKAIQKGKYLGEFLMMETAFLFKNQNVEDFLQPLLFDLSYGESCGTLDVYVNLIQVSVKKKNKQPSHSKVSLSDENMMHFLLHYCFKRSLEVDFKKIKGVFGTAWDRFTMEVKHDQ